MKPFSRLLAMFTRRYAGERRDLYKKAQTIAILNILFLVLILLFFSMNLIFTGAFAQDAQILLSLAALVFLNLILLSRKRIHLAVYFSIISLMLAFSLIVFLSTGRNVLKIYNLGFYYIFIILVAGLVGTSWHQSAFTGLISMILGSWFFFFRIVPEQLASHEPGAVEPGQFVGLYDSYASVMLILFAATFVSLFLNMQLQRAFTELQQLNNELEDEVEQRTGELQETLNSLRHSKAQLVEAEKLAALGGLVGGISHEINTPLGNSLTAVTHGENTLNRLLADFRTGSMSKSGFAKGIDDIQQSHKVIQRNLEAAIALLERFKRISSDQHSERPQRFNVRNEIDNVLVAHQNTLKRLNELHIDIEGPEDLDVVGYPGMIWQILTNFLQNTLKHGLPDGRGTIRIVYSLWGDDSQYLVELDEEDAGEAGEHSHSEEQAGAEVQLNQGEEQELIISFADDGTGMTNSVREKIYEPFFTTNREEGGTGLGLNIVYNLIQKMGGALHCVSSPGMGARFIIRIPVHPN